MRVVRGDNYTSGIYIDKPDILIMCQLKLIILVLVVRLLLQ